MTSPIPTNKPMNTQIPGDPLPLMNIYGDGKAPEERLPNVVDARSMVATLMQANRERARVNAKIKGQIDGNSPYDSTKLRNAAQQYRVNVNWMEAKAKVSAACVPFYELFAGATYYVDIETDFGTDDDNATWSRVITEEVDRTLKAWEPFDWNMQLMINDFIAYGKSFLFMPDKQDWKFNCIQSAKFLFPDGTESFSEKWEVMVIRQSMRVNDLWNIIKNKSSAEAAGWNVQAVVDAIVNAMPKQSTSATTLYDYDFVQQQIKDHDILQGIRCKTVQAAHVYVKEFSGKVSHLILTEAMTGSTQYEFTAKRDEYLYKSIGAFDGFSDAISTFIFETQDGSINGTQGLGHQIFSAMETKNRLLCSTVDLAFLRSSITMQAQTAAAFQKLNMIQMGAFTILPPDFAVQQSTIMGDMNAPLECNRMLDMVIDNNTGVYRNEGQKEEGNPRTFGEVKLQFMNSAILSNSAVNRFYDQLDKHYQTIIPRMLTLSIPKGKEFELANETRDRIVKRGVPADALKSLSAVRAYRVNGNGSMYLRQQSIMGMMPLVPMLPEGGKQNWLADAIAVTTNQHMVNRYLPPTEVQKLPTDQMDLALLENAAVKSGAPVTWTPTQNNVVHSQTHLLAASQAAASLSQGADPMEVLRFLKGIGQHVAIHLRELANDPSRKNEFKVFQQQFMTLASFTDKLQKQVMQLQQQRQQNQQMQLRNQMMQVGQDPETQQKIIESKQDMIIKGLKAKQQMGIKQQKAQQDMALADARTASEISRQSAESQNAMQLAGVE